MSCVTQGETSILWNGEPLNPLSDERGLRQGDPLSPYLFVLCLEYLSNLINEAVENKKWVGIKTDKSGIMISHLMFADDLILFAKAEEGNCRVFMDILNTFCTHSGQRVNFQK